MAVLPANIKRIALITALLCGVALAQQTLGPTGGNTSTLGTALPTPASTGLCFTSTGSTQGSWAWGACSGATATNFSALVPSTNATAGTFTATGNTWNFSGASGFSVPAGSITNGMLANNSITLSCATLTQWFTCGTGTLGGTATLSAFSNPQNQVMATPNGSAGQMNPRALVGADIPQINLAASGNGGVTGTLPGANMTAVNLASGANGGVTGNLPVGNLFSGTGAASNTFLSGTGWATVTGATASCPNTAACVDATSQPGADMCAKITAALQVLSNNAGTVDARGFTGTQVCSVATATGSATNGLIPNANCQLKTQGGNSCTNAIVGKGKILLGPVNWYLPVVSTEAGNTGGGAGSKVNYDRIGTVVVPAGFTIEGIGNNASGAIGNQTNIRACQGLNSPVSGCTAPATTEVYQITSITVTQQTAAPGRQYMHIVTSTQSDIVGGQPFRISGALASGNVNMVDFNNSFTACESSAYSDVVTDPSCGGGAGGLSTTGAGDIYAAVSSGITSLTVTAVGSGYGGTPPTCTLPAPANAGGVQATCIATVSAGAVSGLYVVNRGTGYASGTTAGTVTLSGNATATFQTIPSSCTRGTNVNCGYLYGELPLFQLMNFAQGTTATVNQGVGVSMGNHMQNLNIDCENVPTCVGIMARSIQEGSEIKDNWFGNSPDRDFDMHGFQTQNTDAMVGNRDSLNSLANRQLSVTAGAYTFGAGTLTLTVGANSFIPNGILYIWGSPANIGCAKSVNMNNVTLPTYPTTIPLPVISVSATQVVLDDSGTNCATSGSGNDTYNIGEICEPGKEAIYWGDVGPHGLIGQTLDISGCVNTGGFPAPANAAIRLNVNSTSSDFILGGHAEGVLYGALAGDAGAFKGFDFISWAGIPTPNVGGFGNNNQAGGEYQSEQSSSAIKIRSEFNTTPSGPATTDYMAQNIQRNNSSGFYYTVNDDNPVGPTLTDGGHIQDSVTSLYAVDLAGSCEVMLTTASVGNNLGCGAAIAPGKGGNAAIFQGQTGGTANTFTANTVTIYGNWYNQSLLSGMTHLNWNISNPDNTADLYDIGLYGPCAAGQAACPLAVHLGATAGTTFANSAGLKGGAVAIVPTPVTLPPGNYYIAGTCNATCTATLISGPVQMQIVQGNSATASAGGVLPAVAAIPAAGLQSVSLPQTGLH
jgi:hypothetical protein